MFESEPVGFSLAGGFVTVVATAATASLLLAPAEVAGRVLIMAIAVCAYAACGVRAGVALVTAVMAWFFGTGFLVNGAGELSFGRPDLLRLGLFVVVALGANAGTAVCRAVAARRRLRVPLPSEDPSRLVLARN
ncbi:MULTISPECIES: hypothetical protein [unclassified Streptosporangium]|uniref:hypothetical protein n=1 Tax=unclassified Streptosporangium TaxID=2632669 RepID=UPI002E27B24B|nr:MULTISPECIES: hypothetical protein [unclassified Streptosporangium]